MSAWGAGMNLNTQSNAGKDAITEGQGVSPAGTNGAEPGAGQPQVSGAAVGKTLAVKARGKGAGAKAPGAKEEGDGAEDEEKKETPKCELFSATEILVKHLTREADGAQPFVGEWREVFLRALARAPIVGVAARIAGVTRRRALEARMADAEFARRWDEAMEDGADELEAAAFRSAVYGEEKPVYHQGEIKGWTVDYSHAMRSMLLKARRPEVFGDKEEAKSEAPVHMTLEEFRKRVEEARRK
jgi:hypothetical protein